jgi:hypothetical protein
LIELPTRPDFQRGERVRIVHGIFAGQLAPFDGMRPRERVAVLAAAARPGRTAQGRHRQRAGLADSPLDPFQPLSRAIFWKGLGAASIE